jgi:hypothetical protein
MVRCKRYLYHLQFVFNLNTTFWDRNTLLIKKKYNFMKNIKKYLPEICDFHKEITFTKKEPYYMLILQIIYH